jgi:L-malate glycosyltransferase
LNILIITYQGNIAGSTYSISYLAMGLAEKGHNVYIGCPADALLVQLIRDSKVNYIPMRFRSKIDIANIRQIRDVVRKYQIDIIDAQSSLDRYTSVFARWLYRLPVKVVHTRRQVAASIGGPLQKLIYYNGTDRIIAVSRGVRESLVEKGLPASHIDVIYNGTPAEKYEHPNPDFTAALRKKYNIGVDDFVIGSVSRKKRQEQIIQALELLPFRTKLIMVGIDELEAYKPFLDRVRDRHEVIFTGPVPPDEALKFYPLFHVKILSSITEGLSQALLEAMALGIPVIATHAAGNPELITDGENGFTFRDGNVAELAAKIQTLHSDREIRQKFITNGKITALEDFSIENTIKRHEKLFNRLIQPKPI